MRTASTKSDYTNEVRRPSFRRSQLSKRGTADRQDPVSAMKKMQSNDFKN